jgi:hypothetical protein
VGKRRRISRVPSSPSAAPVGEGTCRADPLTLARDARRTFSPTGRSPHTPRSGRNGQLALRGLYIRDSYVGATQLSPGCCECDGIGVTTGDFSESFLRDKKDSAVLADELEPLDRLRECDDIVFADSLLDGDGSHDPSSLGLQADHPAVDPPRRIVAADLGSTSPPAGGDTSGVSGVRTMQRTLRSTWDGTLDRSPQPATVSHTAAVSATTKTSSDLPPHRLPCNLLLAQQRGAPHLIHPPKTPVYAGALQ